MRTSKRKIANIYKFAALMIVALVSFSSCKDSDIFCPPDDNVNLKEHFQGGSLNFLDMLVVGDIESFEYTWQLDENNPEFSYYYSTLEQYVNDGYNPSFVENNLKLKHHVWTLNEKLSKNGVSVYDHIMKTYSMKDGKLEDFGKPDRINFISLPNGHVYMRMYYAETIHNSEQFTGNYLLSPVCWELSIIDGSIKMVSGFSQTEDYDSVEWNGLAYYKKVSETRYELQCDDFPNMFSAPFHRSENINDWKIVKK